MIARWRSRNVDLLVVGLAALLAVLVSLSSIDAVALRLPLTILLPTVLTGYAITAAVDASHRLTGLETVLYSIGLSLATAALTGLALNRTSEGLVRTQWAIGLAAIVVVAVAVAWLRRTSATDDPRTAAIDGPATGPRKATVLAALIAAIVTIGSLVFANLDARSVEDGVETTALFAVPTADGDNVRVGITHHGEEEGSFRVTLAGPRERPIEIGPVTVPAEGTWSEKVEAASAPDGLTARLLSGESGEVLRTATLAPSQGR